MLKNETLVEYVQLVDSASPAPGGGSVSGYVGAVGVALARMYGHLSIPKQSFSKWSIEQQKTFSQHFSHLQTLEQHMMQVVDDDTALYPMVMEAYKLPKDTPEHIIQRQQAIQYALKKALEGPLDLAYLILDALSSIETMIPYGNASVASDAACAVIFLIAACEATLYNVKINLQSITDEIYCANKQQEYNTIAHRLPTLKNQLLEICEKRMTGE